MKTLKYDGYLTETKLLDLCEQLYGKENVVSQYRFDIEGFRRFKYDIAVLDSYGVVIKLFEFDGDTHYRNIGVIESDFRKSLIVEHIGVHVRRIPYFIQLDTEVARYFFSDKDIVVNMDYPHGFIDKKAVLPSNFCSFGEIKFLADIKKHYPMVEDAIAISLHEKLYGDNRDDYILGAAYVNEWLTKYADARM